MVILNFFIQVKFVPDCAKSEYEVCGGEEATQESCKTKIVLPRQFINVEHRTLECYGYICSVHIFTFYWKFNLLRSEQN